MTIKYMRFEGGAVGEPWRSSADVVSFMERVQKTGRCTIKTLMPGRHVVTPDAREAHEAHEALVSDDQETAICSRIPNDDAKPLQIAEVSAERPVAYFWHPYPTEGAVVFGAVVYQDPSQLAGRDTPPGPEVDL